MNNSIAKTCTPAGTHLFHGFRVFLALFLAGLGAALAPVQCPSIIWQAIVFGLIIGATIKFLTKRAKFLRASLPAFVGCILSTASGFAGTLTITVPSGGPVLVGDPLLNVPASLATLLPVFSGNLDGDNVYIYNCSGTVTCYAIDSGSPSGFDDCSFNQLPNAPVIDPGQGFIYVNNQGATETFTFTGTPGAPLLPPANYCGCGSWSLLCGSTNSSSYQQATGFVPQQGAQVSTNYTGGAIEPSYTFSGGVWTPSTPVLTPGRAAFFYVPCSTNCSPISLSPDPLPEGMPGVFYHQTLTASGGNGPYTYGITAGALPFDLTLSSSGVLSGEPTTLGVYGFTVTATNTTGCTGSQTYYLTNVCATLTLSPSTLPGYTIGAPYSQTLNASGSTPPYYYTVRSGTLPPGNPAFTLSLDTGVLSGTPTSGGTYCFTVTATTTNGCTASMTYCLATNNCPAITLSPPSLNSEAQVGQPYSQQFTASGSSATPCTFTAPDGTPPGLTLFPDGTLAGTNTASGIFCFMVTATDTNGCTDSRSYCLTNVCPAITFSPNSLPDYTKNVPYNQTITASPGGTPYTFTVTSGSLPPGNPPVTLSPTGVLSGTPMNNGVYCFTVTATEDGCSASMNCCLTNTACPTITLSPPSLNSEGQVGQAYGQLFTASGSSATPCTFTAPDGTPPGLTLFPDGTLAGTNTASGIFCFMVTATDTNGCTDSRSYCLTNICPNITFSPNSLPGYTNNVSYHQTISASPSGTPYTFTVSSGSLPPGNPPVTLSLGGVLSGTPTNNGVYCFTVTATEDGCSASMNYCLTNTSCPTITVSPASLNSEAQVGQAYSQQFTASGSSATPCTFTAPDGTPPGLILYPNGTLAGTNTASGVFCFLVTATDTNGCTGSRGYCLTNICPNITFSPGSLPGYTKNVSYNQTITASPSGTPYTFTVTSGSLPPGNPPVTLSPTGVLSGTPTNNGVYCFTVTASEDGCSASMNYCLTNTACPTITLSPPSLNSEGQVGQAYGQLFTASGSSAPPYTFTAPEGTPPGLTLLPDGMLAGTNTASGIFCFMVTATDTNGCTGSRNYCLTNICPNLTISPASLPNGTLGSGYSQTLTASGETGPYTFKVTGGTAPTWLTLSLGGVLSGTPTAPGSSTFTVTATTTNGCAGSTNYTLTVNCGTITLAPGTLPAGTAEGSYSQTISASGGGASYTYTATGGTLPAGLTLTSGGKLSGIPTTPGVSSFTVTAMATNGCTGSTNYTLTVNCGTITLAPGTLPAGTAESSYSQTISASGGGASYTYTVTGGTLPAGLTLTSGGKLSGIPTTPGVSSFTVTAMATNGCTGSTNYTLTVNCGTITLAPGTLPAGTAEGSYSQTISASGGGGSYTYTVTGGTLPAGLTLTSGGKLSGAPTTPGVSSFTVTAMATNGCTGSAQYTLTVNCGTITLAPGTLPAGTAEGSYSQTISASGGGGSYTYTVTGGTLPAGLTLTSGGKLSGALTTPGVSSFTVTAKAADGCTGSAQYTLTVNCGTITLAPGTLPAGTAEGSYSQTISASGGGASYTYTVTGGTLPAGLTLTSGGLLNGTPTTPGVSSFTVTAKADGYRSTARYALADGCTGSAQYTLTVNCGMITLAPGTLPAGTAEGSYSQTISASGGGLYTYTVTGGTLPAGLTLTSGGLLSGTPTTPGVSSFTVTAKAADGCTGSAQYILTVNCGTITLAPGTLPAGTYGFNYNQTITVNGGSFFGTTYNGGSGADGTVFQVTTNGALTTLVAFSGANGANPAAGLVQGSDGNFYGTTYNGGGSGLGTVFTMTPKGELTTLYAFLGASDGGSDGFEPLAGLVRGNDGNFYGTTYKGGGSDLGTVFKVTPNEVLTPLVSFSGANGANPQAGLVLGNDGNFYGTTYNGGGSGLGTVFKVTPDGVLTRLVSFSGANGANPQTGLVQGSDGNFYGTTQIGYEFNNGGTVFKVTPGGVLTTLVSFSGSNPIPSQLVQGSDGNFYGTTEGLIGNNPGEEGTVFQVTPNGVLTTLVSFSFANGAFPMAGLVQGSDGNFYGTTTQGGASGHGTVFAVTSSGVLTTLYSFAGDSDGLNPYGSLVQAGAPYTYTVTGGALPPGLTLTSSGLLSGTPTQPGVSTFTVTATDLFGCLGSASYTLTVNYCPAITLDPATLPAGTSGGTYSQIITANGSKTAPYVFTVTHGTLPAGLTLTSDGLLSGKPTTPGGSTFTITATDADGCTGSAQYTLPVNCPAITVSPVSLPAGTTGAGYSQTITANGGSFYGTTYNGGSSADGTVFQVTANGALTTLVDYSGDNGANPAAGLVQGSDGNFYGTTYNGGGSGLGTVFTMTPKGELTTLHAFLGAFDGGSDGNEPLAGLVQGNDGNFYGTTYKGGDSDLGMVFKVTPNGVLTPLVSFSGANGANPQAGLVLGNDGNFYGTTYNGGGSGLGTVFKVTPNGVLTPLVSFSGANGANPQTGLVQGSDGNFYGTTRPGDFNGGTVFKVTPGGVLTTLVSFIGSNPIPSQLVQGSDGNFYGTTEDLIGNNPGEEGTVFQVTPNGVLTTLVSFSGANGAFPMAGLVQGSDGNFYGTTTQGGASGHGTVFAVTSSGVLTTLYSFAGDSDGLNPYGSLVQAGGGTAPYIFTVTVGALPPGLTLTSSGLLSGTPTQPGVSTFTITATDAEGCTGSTQYTLTVN